MTKPLRFAIIGCGFWARYQLAAWLELGAAQPVALYNRTKEKALALASAFDLNINCYDDIDALFRNETVDFVDIITDADTHEHFAAAAARYGIAAICQKPMAPSLEAAEAMLVRESESGRLLLIHENFRWQSPIRKVKDLLVNNSIGQPFKANIRFCSAYPVFENQPFLATLDHFIISDIGSHILDVSRFLLGEANSLYCLTQRINAGIKGEDVANIFMEMESGLHCYVEMSYASKLERESFPETLLLIEGSAGSIELQLGHRIVLTNNSGTVFFDVSPPKYSWADPDYALVHSSIVACNRNLLEALEGRAPAETTAADNFETVKLVWAAYESAAKKKVITLHPTYVG